MFIKRDLSGILERYVKFPVIAIIGPRQSGKTTLAKHYFSSYRFVNLEKPDVRAFAKNDPNAFLASLENPHGVIIDEFQYVPELLSYIQVIVDEKKRPGYFVLTGSQNFLMNQAITQSLAGRVGILTLLPLSIHELQENHLIKDVNTTMFKGNYARIFSEDINPLDFYPSYIKTYIERDVRQLTNIGEILIFQKFMQLCAARIGQAVNIEDLATNTGVDQRTIKKWLSLLEASYILYLLKPYYKNFNKRLTKTPKLYFYDTGLACSLLDIKSPELLALSPYRGNLFECLILSDFQKQYCNSALQSSLYFWRDQNGRIEVDGLIDRGDTLFPIEIKAGATISQNYFTAINEWSTIAGTDASRNTIVYTGQEEQKRGKGHVITWIMAGTFIAQLYAPENI